MQLSSRQATTTRGSGMGTAQWLDILERYQARLSFTCVEMRDCEHPNEARCSPQGWCPTLRLAYSTKAVEKRVHCSTDSGGMHVFERQVILFLKALGLTIAAAFLKCSSVQN